MRFSKLHRKSSALFEFSLGDMAVFLLLQHTKEETGIAQIRMSDLSTWLGISPPAVTQTVSRLCRRGLIEKFRCPDDRRSSFIRPTAMAESILGDAMEEKLAMTDRVIEKMGERDIKQLLTLLDRLHQTLASEIQKEENQ